MRWMTSGLLALALAATPFTAYAQPDQPQTQQDTFEYEASSGPRLGIMVTGLSQELRAYYGAPSDRGVLVARVAPNSPAARAGLRVGDVVTAVSGQSIGGADDVIGVLSNLDRGETFSIDIIRDKKALTLQAKLPGQRQVMSNESSSAC